MSTKLIAAELATAAGVTTFVMHSGKVSDIFQIIDEDNLKDGQGPLCTRFERKEVVLTEYVGADAVDCRMPLIVLSRKWWIAHGLHAAGTLMCVT